MKIVRVNRYGLSFAQNKNTTATYATASGKMFSSYYRVACTRCGWPFALRRGRASARASGPSPGMYSIG